MNSNTLPLGSFSCSFLISFLLASIHLNKVPFVCSFFSYFILDSLHSKKLHSASFSSFLISIILASIHVSKLHYLLSLLFFDYFNTLKQASNTSFSTSYLDFLHFSFNTFKQASSTFFLSVSYTHLTLPTKA